MIHKSYTIRFILHRRKDTPRQHLQMRVTPRGGKPISFATGISLTDHEWDPLLGIAKGRTPQAAEANTLIAQWSQIVANIFTHYDSLNISPTADQLRQAFARATTENTVTPDYTPQPTTSPTLLAAYTQFLSDRQHEWSAGTLDTMTNFRKLLSDFARDTRLDMLNGNFLQQFHQWLVDTRHQQGVTVHGNLTRIKWFIKWARRKGIYTGNADNEYIPKVKGAKERNHAIIYLTHDELQKVEQYQFSEHHKNVSKDVFLFCCYTGLRSSDILGFRKPTSTATISPSPPKRQTIPLPSHSTTVPVLSSTATTTAHPTAANVPSATCIRHSPLPTERRKIVLYTRL